MNIPTELEQPTSGSAKNVCVSVYPSNNFVKSLNSAITRDISSNTGTLIGFSSTESTNE